VSEVRWNRSGEHEGEVVSVPRNFLAVETHRGGATSVRVEGRAAQRGLTVVEALRRAPVAPRWSYDVRRE
jgi:hypothetical protein